MEKRLLLAIVLCVGVLIGWTWLQATFFPAPRPQVAPPAAPPVVHTTSPEAPAPQAPQAPPAPPAPQGNGAQPPAPATEPPTELPIRTDRLNVLVSSRGGASLRTLESWGCIHHPPRDRSVPGDPGVGTEYVLGRDPALSIAVRGLGGDSLQSQNWALVPQDGGVLATSPAGGPVIVRALLTPSTDPAAPYHLRYVVTVENATAAAGTPLVLEVVGPWFPTSVLSPLIQEDGIVLGAAGESVEQIAPEEIAEMLAESSGQERQSQQGWRFIGMRRDFYLSALMPATDTVLPSTTAVGFRAAKVLGRRPTDPPVHTAAATFRIPFALPKPGETATWSFVVYAGPNSRDVLGATGSPYLPLEDAFPNRSFLGLRFGWIGNLMGWLLSIFAEKAGLGWGLAVCALTVLVRGALFPLSRKSQISMRLHAVRMAKLKPKLDEVKKKYADNPRKQQEMTMKLFREEKVSILPGGCLLALLQMPVWISLYATLQTTFEMRHASFLWVKDLTVADHLAEIPFARGWWIVDGWFNLLPLLMMVTWWGSAAMQPLPEEPEQRAQAKMMRWIPVLFGVMLYGTAAGLTLYMTLSALWSIGESWLIKRVWLSKIGPVPAVPAAT